MVVVYISLEQHLVDVLLEYVPFPVIEWMNDLDYYSFVAFVQDEYYYYLDWFEYTLVQHLHFHYYFLYWSPRWRTPLLFAKS